MHGTECRRRSQHAREAVWAEIPGGHSIAVGFPTYLRHVRLRVGLPVARVHSVVDLPCQNLQIITPPCIQTRGSCAAPGAKCAQLYLGSSLVLVRAMR